LGQTANRHRVCKSLMCRPCFYPVTVQPLSVAIVGSSVAAP
jgi:hypothetical protein